MEDLYNLDFFQWTAHNAELLRAGRFSEADITHIAEGGGEALEGIGHASAEMEVSVRTPVSWLGTDH